MTHFARIMLTAIVALGGCATALKSKTTPISVTSATPGATVFVDGKQAGITPMTVELPNATDAVISVHKDDKEESCRLATNASIGWIAADLLLTGGIGIVVDWATHGWNNVGPTACHVGV
jgi:PEGA domain-containing protein